MTSLALDDVSETIKNLNLKNTNDNITFSKNISPDEYTSGVCSALSFEFLDLYLKRNKNKSLEETFEGINSTMHTGNVERFSYRQTALNTIELKDRSLNPDLLHADKMQSLLNLHSIEMRGQNHVKKFDASQWPESNRLLNDMNEVEDGTYVLRGIKPKNNVKLEEHGHTFIFIREKGVDYLFDPNSGLRKMKSSDTHHLLKDTFDFYNKPWAGLSEFRFYRVEDTIASALNFSIIGGLSFLKSSFALAA